MATFRVARASEYLVITGCGVGDVKLAKKAWVWLGLQRCKTLDVSPVTYQLDANGDTSDSFPVFLFAALTVGPKINNNASSAGDNTKKPADEKEDPVLLYAKLVAPSRGKNKGACSKSHVKQLIQGVLDGHVAAVAAGMTTEQILVKGSVSFAKKVLDRVQADVAKFGIQVYHGNVR